jgi:hypothetical protein
MQLDDENCDFQKLPRPILPVHRLIPRSLPAAGPEQLDDAVKAEDYELAAKIRDRIRNGEKVSADGTGDGADAVEH